MDELGTTSSEGAILEFTVKHLGTCPGTIKVNSNIEYEDNEGNIVVFGDPTIEVECDEPICIEKCPKPIEIIIDGCDDTLEYDVGDLSLSSLGRILEISTKIKNVCPNRRIALSAILTEVDDNNIEYKRGMKTLVIPAHNHSTCRDIKVDCIKFVLPETLNVNGSANSLCNTRKFNVRLIANYIDYNFYCNNNLI